MRKAETFYARHFVVVCPFSADCRRVFDRPPLSASLNLPGQPESPTRMTDHGKKRKLFNPVDRSNRVMPFEANKNSFLKSVSTEHHHH